MIATIESTRGAVFLLAVLLLYLCWQGFVHAARCGYCGQINRHDEHCPWNTRA